MENYYDVLKVPRSADEQEIKKSYRGLAMKFHPDRNQIDDTNKQFAQICRAYEVLSSKLYRAVYDQLGDSGLNERQFKSKPPHEVFEDFFGTKNPYATINYKKLLEEEKHVVLPDTIYSLDCTVADLYNGCVKTFEISRTVLVTPHAQEPANFKEETKILNIVVKPGWKVGTRVVFPKAGDQKLNALAPADVVFVITLKPSSCGSVDETTEANSNYSSWRIAGNDLIYVHKLSLLDALCGGVIRINTLDGRVISVARPEIAHPTYEKRVQGEGMPIWKSSIGEKGDLIIQFDIAFPTQLSLASRGKLKEILKK